jgi:hypothetical protein
MSREDLLPPPWLKFKGAEPMWSGWRQGNGEDWLVRLWLPFWRGLSEAGRDEYLRRWPPPDSDWYAQLLRWRS